MGSMRLKLLLAAASLTALAACATVPQLAGPAPRESTAFTLATDQPRTPEQMAMQFDKADLTLKVMPSDKAIDAVAVLDFTATAPLERLVVELDTLLTISSVPRLPQTAGPIRRVVSPSPCPARWRSARRRA